MSKRCMGCMEYYGDEFDICPHCGYIEGTPPEEAIHMEPGTLLHDRYIIGRVLGFSTAFTKTKPPISSWNTSTAKR